MVITNFQIKNKVGKLKYFLEIFLIIDTKVEIILKILFLKFSNSNMFFGDEILT